MQLYDTTLRDGAQTEGVTFGIADKVSIASKLSDYGFGFIEAGWPGANPHDDRLFPELMGLGLRAKVAAFGMTSRDPASGRGIGALLKSGADVITVFGKSWEMQAREVLRVSPGENLRMIAKTVEFLKSHGCTVFFDAEHFFDGYRDDPAYALGAVKAAAQADAIVLCDTNGGSMPWEVSAAAKAARNAFHGPLGIHCHDDCGMAVANSLAALGCGCTQVQGTVNGLGERCGNTDWCVFLPVASLKLGALAQVGTEGLTDLSRYVERLTGFPVHPGRPFVGESAFAHKGGVHMDAVLKAPQAYEHVPPGSVGNSRRFTLSDQSGRSGMAEAAKTAGFSIGRDHPAIAEACAAVKAGQCFSESWLFNFLSERVGGKTAPFRLLDYETVVRKKGSAKTEMKVGVGGEVFHEVAEGVGPVHSFDTALRKALGKRFDLSKVALSNFRVRIINQEKATAASVEVFIEFSSDGRKWSAASVSDDVIRASEEALISGYKYYLLKPGG